MLHAVPHEEEGIETGAPRIAQAAGKHVHTHGHSRVVQTHHGAHEARRTLASECVQRPSRGIVRPLDEEPCRVLEDVCRGEHEVPAEEVPPARRIATKRESVAADGRAEQPGVHTAFREERTGIDVREQAVDPEVQGQKAVPSDRRRGIGRSAAANDPVDLCQQGIRYVGKHPLRRAGHDVHDQVLEQAQGVFSCRRAGAEEGERHVFHELARHARHVRLRQGADEPAHREAVPLDVAGALGKPGHRVVRPFVAGEHPQPAVLQEEAPCGAGDVGVWEPHGGEAVRTEGSFDARGPLHDGCSGRHTGDSTATADMDASSSAVLPKLYVWKQPSES